MKTLLLPFNGMTSAFLTEKISGWLNNTERMAEEETQDLVKAIFGCFHVFIHILVLCHGTLQFVFKF
jgi:hypothetical protein